MSCRVLVTGGAGYIGSHVVKLLGEAGYDVITYDNLSTGNRNAVLHGKLVVGDLGDTEKLDEVFRDYSPVAVMHFAGSIIVPESVSKPLDYYTNNTQNSLSLMRMCEKYKVRHFIFSSTAAVYGELPGEGIAIESMAKNPINPYGASKLMTEMMLQDFSNSSDDFTFVALRYFNVSGADLEGKIGQAFPGATHLIKVNCEAATGKRDKTYIFGTDFNTPDGTGVRDYIHVLDLASAHVVALEYLLKGGKSDIFNCGYGRGYSVKEVVAAVKAVTGVNFQVETAARREGDPAKLVSDVSKIKQTLPWEVQYDDLNLIIESAYNWERSEILSSWQSR